MFDPTELAVLRRAYAKQVLFQGHSTNAALEEAFASVARENYLGLGPWPILRWPRGYALTPDADPAWLYADILIGIQPERGLNNGQPSLHAALISASDPKPGEHIVHIGAGVGYYTAIMARMLGETGRITAIEFDGELARRAAKNLSPLPNASVIEGAGSAVAFDQADIIYVNAGASRPADIWLDRLRDGGRLVLPLTTDSNFARPSQSQPDPAGLSGAVFLITRRGSAFDARLLAPVIIFPCEGMRDAASEQALAAAFKRPGIESVKKLRLTGDVPDKDCWVKAPGWSLTYA
jgi:protein-L-isoaspartate(D-aspartate) O-methyltransferase